MPAIEEQRYLHEDLERLEQAIADRSLDEPKNIRDRLTIQHQISNYLASIQQQSQRLVSTYEDADNTRTKEIQAMTANNSSDPTAFDEFYSQLKGVKDFHRRYPHGAVENLERAYKRKPVAEGESSSAEIDNLFMGEEAFGRFFDLTGLHEQYLNLPAIKARKPLTYLQYVDPFDVFAPPQCPLKQQDKMREDYFQYVSNLAQYFEDFMRKTRPLEDLEKVFAMFDKEFEEAWDKDQVSGWESKNNGADAGASDGPVTEGTGAGIWCAPCAKEFSNENVYKAHLGQKKHLRNVAAGDSIVNGTGQANGTHDTIGGRKAQIQRIKERAVAEREFRVTKLAGGMKTERGDTRGNVERRQGMTERERQQEIEALYAETSTGGAQAGSDDEEDDDGEEKIYNPLKLPLAWDGKPIPYWLYKLHGLGNEHRCEICGDFVYMGRRAFDKHFSEPKHTHGLRSLGITSNANLFKDVTSINEAVQLWEKIQREKKKETKAETDVVEMEDNEGHVMPEKVYHDLRKQGLI